MPAPLAGIPKQPPSNPKFGYYAYALINGDLAVFSDVQAKYISIKQFVKKIKLCWNSYHSFLVKTVT